jgi:hypothetical protein
MRIGRTVVRTLAVGFLTLAVRYEFGRVSF